MSVEQVLPTPIEIVTRRERRERELGKRAIIDGFEILSQVESPHDVMRRELQAKIVEQSPAIEAIIEALDRAEVRLESDSRPIANLAFLGPTGVGKSETAKTLSQLLGDGEGNLIKIDCSNFSHGHEVASLIGSPPGYVGRDQEPYLDRERVEQPGTVILFDEIEKGSRELYNLMLQIMGDGELRLNNGETASFRDTIIILTSNLGAKEMSAELSTTPLGFGDRKTDTSRSNLDRVARKSFAEFFTPEFTNRLNKLVVFHPLSHEALGKVLDVKMDEANNEYEQSYGARISLSEATRQHIIGIAANEPHLGARPLVRALEENVQAEFGRYVGSNRVPDGTHVRIFHRSEVPEQYAASDQRELMFAMKPDESLARPVMAASDGETPVYHCNTKGEVQLFQAPLVGPHHQ